MLESLIRILIATILLPVVISVVSLTVSIHSVRNEVLARVKLFGLICDFHRDSIASFLIGFVFVVIDIFFPLSFLVLELLVGVIVSFPLLSVSIVFLVFSLLVFTLFEIIILLPLMFQLFAILVISDNLLHQGCHH